MADTRKIVIEINNIKNESRPFDYGITDSGNSPTPIQAGNATAKDNSESRNVLGKSVILNQAISSAKQAVIRTVRSSANRYFSLSEDYLAETTYGNVETLISKSTGLVSATVGGGMIGGAVGAVIGAVGWGFNEAVSYRDRMSGYYQNLNASRIQAGFESKRAGLTDGSRGTEN